MGNDVSALTDSIYDVASKMTGTEGDVVGLRFQNIQAYRKGDLCRFVEEACPGSDVAALECYDRVLRAWVAAMERIVSSDPKLEEAVASRVADDSPFLFYNDRTIETAAELQAVLRKICGSSMSKSRSRSATQILPSSSSTQSYSGLAALKECQYKVCRTKSGRRVRCNTKSGQLRKGVAVESKQRKCVERKVKPQPRPCKEGSIRRKSTGRCVKERTDDKGRRYYNVRVKSGAHKGSIRKVYLKA